MEFLKITSIGLLAALMVPSLAIAKSPYDDIADSLAASMAKERESDPLKYLAGDMKQVAGDLSAEKTDLPVQEKQQKIVDRLDVLIKQLEQQTKSGSGGANPNPTRPMNRSVIAKGPGGQGEMHDPKKGDKTWAQLPPKQREQILQSKTQQFPPGYESMLQSYYERLAAEDVAGESSTANPSANPQTPPAPPTTQP